eukprot:scaffold63649_cov60-Phaeocystis_antarctica.AAC.4
MRGVDEVDAVVRLGGDPQMPRPAGGGRDVVQPRLLRVRVVQGVADGPLAHVVVQLAVAVEGDLQQARRGHHRDEGGVRARVEVDLVRLLVLGHRQRQRRHRVLVPRAALEAVREDVRFRLERRQNRPGQVARLGGGGGAAAAERRRACVGCARAEHESHAPSQGGGAVQRACGGAGAAFGLVGAWPRVERLAARLRCRLEAQCEPPTHQHAGEDAARGGSQGKGKRRRRGCGAGGGGRSRRRADKRCRQCRVGAGGRGRLAHEGGSAGQHEQVVGEQALLGARGEARGEGRGGEEAVVAQAAQRLEVVEAAARRRGAAVVFALDLHVHLVAALQPPLDVVRAPGHAQQAPAVRHVERAHCGGVEIRAVGGERGLGRGGHCRHRAEEAGRQRDRQHLRPRRAKAGDAVLEERLRVGADQVVREGRGAGVDLVKSAEIDRLLEDGCHAREDHRPRLRGHLGAIRIVLHRLAGCLEGGRCLRVGVVVAPIERQIVHADVSGNNPTRGSTRRALTRSKYEPASCGSRYSGTGSAPQQPSQKASPSGASARARCTASVMSVPSLSSSRSCQVAS